MRRNLFLHFFNRDSREIFQTFRFYDHPEHFQILRRALNVAVFLCEDKCVMPPGFVIEDPIAFDLSEQQRAFFQARLLQLPMRESNLSDYAEKKRLEYMPMRNRYDGLFSDRRIEFLGQNAKGTIKRSSRIGDQILQGWEGAADTKLWEDVKRKIATKDVEILRQIPAMLVQENSALTWSAIAPLIPSTAEAASSPLRNSLQHIYFKEYCSEFKLLVLSGLPFGHEEFGLPKERLVYDYARFSKYLDAFHLKTFVESISADSLVHLRTQNGHVEFVDAYTELAKVCTTETELSYRAQRAANASKFDWARFQNRVDLLVKGPSDLEILELNDALSAAAKEVVSENGLSSRSTFSLARPENTRATRSKGKSMPKLVFYVALQEELDVLAKELRLARTMETPAASGTINGIELDILCPTVMGRVPAAAEVACYLEGRKVQPPKLIVILGLAGGFKLSKSDVGHIIVGTTVVDLASRKLLDSSDKMIQTRFRRVDFPLSDRLGKYLASDKFPMEKWSSKAIEKAEWPKDRRPSLHSGLIACGDEVVASESWQKQMLEHTEKLLGIEMEAGGVCAAAARHNVPVSLLRVVSDHADPAKADDAWRRIGMKSLAILLQHIDFRQVM